MALPRAAGGAEVVRVRARGAGGSQAGCGAACGSPAHRRRSRGHAHTCRGSCRGTTCKKRAQRGQLPQSVGMCARDSTVVGRWMACASCSACITGPSCLHATARRARLSSHSLRMPLWAVAAQIPALLVRGARLRVGVPQDVVVRGQSAQAGAASLRRRRTGTGCTLER